ncbi:MAG TPA: HEPN domain-containing protein [Longimicrobiaceae bacterium]|nr:HEPN domain-containing protein [Longimicrobiaceae bacterium]
MTEVQRALLEKAKKSVDAAVLLADGGMYDFAVSRAYYAMFYVAEAFLAGKGLSFSKHSAVHAAFGQRIARQGVVPAEFHRYLIDAASARNTGDYGVDTGFTREDAGRLIAQAEEFIGMGEQRIPSLSSETDP